MIQELRSEGRLRPLAIRPDGEKIVRLEGQSAVIEAGHVVLPESAPWLEAFLLEILAFLMAATMTRSTASRSS